MMNIANAHRERCAEPLLATQRTAKLVETEFRKDRLAEPDPLGQTPNDSRRLNSERCRALAASCLCVKPDCFEQCYCDDIEYWEGHSCQPPPLVTKNFELHTARATAIYADLLDYYAENGDLSSQNKLGRLTRSDRKTLKPILTKFRAEMGLDRASEKNGIYIMIFPRRAKKELHRGKFTRVNKKEFSYKDQLEIDDATHVLFAQEPNTTYLITLHVPSNSEAADIAVCSNSDVIAMRVVRALGDKFVAVWERQEKGRLHMHIFMSFDKNSVPDRNRLCEIWMAALPPAALVKSDGSKYSASEVLNFKYGIHIVKFHLEDRRGPHPFTYLAKGSQTYTPH